MPLTNEIKQAALVGLRHQRDQIDTKITELERELRSTSYSQPAPQKKRRMSAAGRKRAADAQRKRWAKVRKEKKAAG